MAFQILQAISGLNGSFLANHTHLVACSGLAEKLALVQKAAFRAFC